MDRIRLLTTNHRHAKPMLMSVSGADEAFRARPRIGRIRRFGRLVVRLAPRLEALPVHAEKVVQPVDQAQSGAGQPCEPDGLVEATRGGRTAVEGTGIVDGANDRRDTTQSR